MKNTYKLIWSNEALEGLKEIFAYLEHKFSERDAQIFARKFDKHLKIIQSNPETFRLSLKSKSVRRCVIAKLTSVYYTVGEESIKLITITDNRKSPKNFIS